MSNLCPVCGYDELDKPAYRNNQVGGLGSQEICPSCGFQFGWTDDDLGITFDQWRRKWVAEGMKWQIEEIEPPLNWNPQAQLLSVGVKV